jgi:hypothetical protein
VDETSLGLFFKVATRDKYLVLLTGSWVVVARDTSYAAIYLDWTLLNKHVQIAATQEDKVRTERWAGLGDVTNTDTHPPTHTYTPTHLPTHTLKHAHAHVHVHGWPWRWRRARRHMPSLSVSAS